MKISAAFPPVPATPEHIALAEALGYSTAWVYDTPALQLDCWMTLALAATRTRRIRLGPGVIDSVAASPHGDSLGHRHAGLARRQLAGDTVEIEGAATRMLHWPGQAPNRPIEVPFVLGVNGPKGLETAAAMRCGVITSRPRPDANYDKSLDVILLGFGTILDQGETLSSPRVINTAGPGAMVAYHAFLEQHDARLDHFPNAKRFVELANAVDPGQRTWRCILAI